MRVAGRRDSSLSFANPARLSVLAKDADAAREILRAYLENEPESDPPPSS